MLLTEAAPSPGMLAIAGGKGGSGKTTTALGLAAALGRAGRRPVVVDADRDMPDLHALAGAPPAPGLADLAAGRPLDAVAHPAPDHPGVQVVPAVDARETAVGTALDRTRGYGDAVLVDCPAGAGPAAAAPLRAADRVLVVSTPRPASLRDAAKTVAMARALGTPPTGAAITQGAEVPAGAERLLGCPTLGAVPAVGGSPLEAAAVRVAYARLTARVLGENV